MKALRLAAAIMLLSSPAFAQVPQLNLLQDNRPAKTQEERDAESATDKAYKDSLKKIPDGWLVVTVVQFIRSDASARPEYAFAPIPAM